jgi:hypothetical protein
MVNFEEEFLNAFAELQRLLAEMDLATIEILLAPERMVGGDLDKLDLLCYTHSDISRYAKIVASSDDFYELKLHRINVMIAGR